MHNQNRTIHRVASALVGLLFVIAGINKVMGFEYVAQWMTSAGLPMAPVLLVLTVVLEIGAGLMLVTGFKARWGALALAAFLIPTTLVFHAFWSAEGAQFQDQITQFLKNTAIFGATLMIAFPRQHSS
ncbi:DoxX family protein [Dokdonella sp.]|uniref:DoxX family protein n=1 Tax=Dokdonella sp. TaxID=2291710 RepID=UPI003C4A2A30